MQVEHYDTSWPAPGLENQTFKTQQPDKATSLHQTLLDADLHLGLLNVIQQPYALGLLSCLPFILTYILTQVESKTAMQSSKVGRKAPLTPYAIPIIGHAAMFVWSLGALVHKNNARFGKYVPVRFRGMFTELAFVSGPKNVALIFRRSKDFAAKASVVIAMDRLFGSPQRTVRFYDDDNSGMEMVPHSYSNVREEDRIHHIVHVQVIKYLSGNGLKPMTQRFMENMGRQIFTSGVGSEWLEMDDLFGFCQVKLLEASLDAMFGPYLTALNPNFVDDYWKFDQSTAYLLKGFPKWIVPQSWKARQRCLDSLKKYNAYANKLHDGDGRKDYEGLDPFFGTEFIRQRKEAMSKMGTFDEDAIAAEDLAIMWATNSNSIPAAFWFLYEIFSDPVLLSRVREEVDECILPSSDPDAPPQFDLTALGNSPLLQSCYAETLRLRTAILVTRVPERDDFKLGDYVFPKNNLIMVASQTAHMDEDVWNTGTGEAPHPINTFWAERFLVHPDAPGSGPLKHAKAQRPKQSLPEIPESVKEKPRFSTEGLSGAWIPYGGGQTLCPGRHYAKQEMLVTFAILASAFDLEILHAPGVKTEANTKYFGLGVMPPKNKTPIRIRRRKQTVL